MEERYFPGAVRCICFICKYRDRKTAARTIHHWLREEAESNASSVIVDVHFKWTTIYDEQGSEIFALETFAIKYQL